MLSPHWMTHADRVSECVEDVDDLLGQEVLPAVDPMIEGQKGICCPFAEDPIAQSP